MRLEKRGCHPAAHYKCTRASDESLDDRQLVRDLCSADYGNQGVLGRFKHGSQHLQLPLHEEAGNGRQEIRHSFSGGVRPVSGPKGVVHIYVRQVRQVLSKGRIIAFFSRIEPEIFEHDDLSGLHRLDRFPDGRPC